MNRQGWKLCWAHLAALPESALHLGLLRMRAMRLYVRTGSAGLRPDALPLATLSPKPTLKPAMKTARAT